MSKFLVKALAVCLFVAIPFGAFAQKKNANYLNYIEKYNVLAVEHMRRFKIPASITLAQGLLESGAGMSQFVKKSNNHFGIKCHNDWKGPRVYHNDDNPNDCFRKYKKAEDSFEDHSRFLAERSRYARLFKLDIYDYKGWSKGLQQCGYATDKAYANKLIKIIETYELYKYDRVKQKKSNAKRAESTATPTINRSVYKAYGLIYVEADANDSFDSIAKDIGFKVKDLLKYNEVPEDFPLYKGDIVYLQKKKKRADKPHFEHVVQVGESIHGISQRYGIRLSNLYKMNKLDDEYVPSEGDVLRLR